MATPQTQPQDASRLERLHNTLSNKGIVKGLPEFEKFREDMSSLGAQRALYDNLKKSGAMGGLPEFEKFQSDFFGRPTPASGATNGAEDEADGSPTFNERFDRRRQQRIAGWREQSEELNRTAQRLESEARSAAIPIPGGRSRPDPGKMREAGLAREERNRLLKNISAGEQTVLAEQDTGQSRISHAGSSFARGVAETLGESTLKSVGILGDYLGREGELQFDQGGRITGAKLTGEIGDLTDNRLYQLGQEFGDAAREMFPTNPRFQQEFLTSVLPQGAGSMAAFLAGGLVSKGLKLGALGAGVLGGLTISSQEFDRALEHGADTETAFQQFLLNIPVGGTEMIPIGRMFRRLDNITGGGVKRLLADGFAGGMEELTQETIQTFLSNASGRALVDNTRELTEGLGEAGSAGFILGAMMNGASRGIQNALRKATSTEERSAAEQAARILEQARQDMESVSLEPAPQGGSIQNPVEISYDPTGTPDEQINQLRRERRRVAMQREQALEAGQPLEDYEAALSHVDNAIGLLEEQSATQPDQRRRSGVTEQASQILDEVDAAEDPVAAAESRSDELAREARRSGIENVAEKSGAEIADELRARAGRGQDAPPELTRDARDFLTAVSTGGAIPGFVSNNLRRIAEENGVRVTSTTTPTDIVESLQAKAETQAETAVEGTPEQASPEQIGQEIEGEIQGEFSEQGLSMAVRTSEGNVLTAPRDQAPTHSTLLDQLGIEPDGVEQGFISPEGRFLSRNEALQYQQSIQPGFTPTAPGTVFAEEVNPQQTPVEYTTSDEEFQVRPVDEGIEVVRAGSDEQVSPESEEYTTAVGEFFAAESADAGTMPRNPNQNDIQYLRSVGENSSNPVQLAAALTQAQQLQEGESDTPVQSAIKERFAEVTGTELTPALAESISEANTRLEQTPTSRGEIAALRAEDANPVGRVLGDRTGRDLSPEAVLNATDGGQFFGQQAIREIEDTQSGLSRSTIVYMSPQQFLDMAAPVPNGVYRSESLKAQNERINSGRPLDGIPQLRIENTPGQQAQMQVSGHEGRHRVKALMDQGITRIPVKLTHPTLRWGSNQARPVTLVGEADNSGKSIEFPESVIHPTNIAKRNRQDTGRTDLQGLTRGEMGSPVTPGTGGQRLAGARQRQENINDQWVADPTPLRDIIEDLVKSAGLTLRQGRIRLRDALGQYNTRSGVIRVQVSEAIEVIAHEAGHDIEQRYGDSIQAVMKIHSEELTPLAYDGLPPNLLLTEGFAEFFRLYITNPANAQAAAPNFYSDFQKWLRAQDNNMYADFNRIRSAYRAFLSQPSDAAAESEIVQTPTRGEALVKKLKEEKPSDIIKNALGKFYRATVGDDDILRVARNQLLDIHYENTGENFNLSPTMDFYKLNRISYDAYSAGAVDIESGVENYKTARAEGVSLRDALAHALGNDWSAQNRKSFSSYLMSRRAVNEWDRFNEGKIPNRPTKLTKKDHQLNIARQEANHPEFKQGADMVNEYTSNLWKKLRDAGLITNEAYQSGLEEHPFYVPFFRDMSDQSTVKEGGGRTGTGKNSVIKAMKGSDRPLLDPIEQIMKMTYEFNMLIKANDTRLALLKMARSAGAGGGAIAEEIPNHQTKAIPVNTEQVIKQLSEVTDWSAYGVRDAMGELLKVTSLDNVDLPDLTIFKQGEINEKGEPIVFAWDKGVRRAIRLSDGEFGMELYNVLTSSHKTAADMITNALAYPASWLRTGVTTEPSFFIANIIRDQVSAWILTDIGFTPFGSVVADISARTRENISSKIAGHQTLIEQNEAFDGDTQREYSRLYRSFSGISTFNVAALDERRAKQEVEKLKTKNIPLRRLKSVRGLNELLDLSEIGTRLGVFQRSFRRAKERGLSDKEAAIEAGFMARDLIDFGRHGSGLWATRRILPFFNAAIQGLDKGVRVLNAEGNLWRAITPYFKDVNGRPLNAEEKGQVKLAQKAWMKSLEIGMLGASLAAIYWDDPEYDEIPQYLKSTHWIFRNPTVSEDSGEVATWVAIPKPFELAFISNTMESLISSYANQDPEWAQEWAKSMWEIVAPPISPIGIQVPGEIWANKRSFDGRPIIYERLLGREPWLQYNSYTSGFGRWMGKQINVSPAVIDHAITGTTGSWGRVLLQATTGAREGSPTPGVEDTWVARRFFRSADRSNRSSTEFWDQVSSDEGEMYTAWGSFRSFFDAGTPAEAFDYYDKLPDHEKLYVAMKYVDDDHISMLPILDQDHPLDNARKASSLLSTLRTDLIEDQGIFRDASADDKRRMDDLIDRLASTEYRNSLIASGLPKYSERRPLEFEEVLGTIRADFPILHQEMIRRYANANLQINPTQQYTRFSQFASNPGLYDGLNSLVQFQRQQIEQQNAQ